MNVNVSGYFILKCIKCVNDDDQILNVVSFFCSIISKLHTWMSLSYYNGL